MAMECDLLSEIEVLQSIYLDELLVSRRDDGGWEVGLVLYPSTAEDSVSQFVRLTLTMTLDQQYPSSSPAISIHNPRGLSDDKLSSVQKCLQLEAQSCLGSPVLYQLIEKAKEILTESNIPHGNCVICLYGFKEGEAFTKTSCYHYFHRHCLGRYVSHSEGELRRREKELEEDKTRDGPDRQELSVVCPVCREPLTYDVDQLLSSPAPQLPEPDEAAISSSFQQKWRELRRLLDRQRAKGGIIDPDEESNRFFIHINETPPAAEDGSLEEDACVPPSAPSSSNATREAGVRKDQFAPGLSHCRGAQSYRLQNPARGQRRGGGARPHHRRAAPIAEHLDKLSLSSEAPIKARGHGNHGQQMPGRTECFHRKTGGSAEQREGLGSPDDRPACLAAPEPEWPEDAAGRRGRRGRRRGPHRPVSHNRAPGSAYNHWDKRPPRNRGGANNLYGRGAGHSRGFHPGVLEREAGGGGVL